MSSRAGRRVRMRRRPSSRGAAAPQCSTSINDLWVDLFFLCPLRNDVISFHMHYLTDLLRKNKIALPKGQGSHASTQCLNGALVADKMPAFLPGHTDGSWSPAAALLQQDAGQAAAHNDEGANHTERVQLRMQERQVPYESLCLRGYGIDDDCLRQIVTCVDITRPRHPTQHHPIQLTEEDVKIPHREHSKRL